MELKDFTKNEQKQIQHGLSAAEITDKEATDKILALVPQEWIKKIPFFVRKDATTKTIERIANQYPELYAVAKKPGELPEKEREELRGIITGIFKEKMKKKVWNQRICHPEAERLPDQKCKPDPGGMEDPGVIKRTCGHLTRCLQVILSRKIEPNLSIRPLQKHRYFFLVSTV